MRGPTPEAGGDDVSDVERADLHPPDELLRIAETLESRGFQAWAVGGAVRDELLGQPGTDWDLATDARPEDVTRVFRRTVPVGIEHGTVGVLAQDGTLYEVTTFRRDVETDGRHAVVEYADTIEEDLGRRDFTINALAWRPATDELRDPYRGREDLRRGVLRAVGEPEERFREDYLRVLRGLRFAGRFRLEIEPRTRRALEQVAPHLDRLSAERVREELVKVLAGGRPSEALLLYGEVGAFEPWLEELSEAAGSSRWQLDLAAVDRLPAHRGHLRLARLLVPVADEGERREELGREVMERLRFSNAELRRVTHLLRHYPPLIGPMDSSAEVRMWLAEVGPHAARDLFRMAVADVRAGAAEERARMLVAAWRRVHGELLSHPPLSVSDLAVDGNDLLELGVTQGPLVGLLLDELHGVVLEDPELNRPDLLRERARELVEMGGLERLRERREPRALEGRGGPGRPDISGPPDGSETRDG